MSAHVQLGAQRLLLTEMLLRIIELSRRGYLDEVKPIDAFELILIGHKIFEMQSKGRATTVSALARALEIPRATLLRKLSRLEKTGIVEKDKARYLMSVAYMNRPSVVQSVRRRVNTVLRTATKLSKMDT